MEDITSTFGMSKTDVAADLRSMLHFATVLHQASRGRYWIPKAKKYSDQSANRLKALGFCLRERVKVGAQHIYIQVLAID